MSLEARRRMSREKDDGFAWVERMRREGRREETREAIRRGVAKVGVVLGAIWAFLALVLVPMELGDGPLRWRVIVALGLGANPLPVLEGLVHLAAGVIAAIPGAVLVRAAFALDPQVVSSRPPHS